MQDVESTQVLQLLEQRGAAVIRLRHGIGRQVSEIMAGHLGARVRRVSDTEVAVLVDGERFTPADRGEHLVGADRQWLADLIAVLVESRAGQFRRIGAEAIRRTMETLKRVRVVFAERAETLVDGMPVVAQNRPLALADAEYPTVVTQRTGDDAAAVLQAISPAVADLIGYPDLAPSIRVCLIDLQREGWSGDSGPTLAMISDAVGEAEYRVREILSDARRPVAELGRRVVAVLAIFDIVLARELWSEIDTFLDETALAEWLSSRITSTGGRPNAAELIALCGHEDLSLTLAGLSAMGKTLRDLNDALAMLGPPFEPVHNAEGIGREFAFFLTAHRSEILAALREAFLPAYEARVVAGGLDRYVARRDLSSLTPDPEWQETYLSVDEQAMAACVNEWLADSGAPPLGGIGREWASLDELRLTNVKLVRDIAAKAAVAAGALRRAKPHEIASSPTVPPASSDGVAEAAIGGGWLDFEPLTEEAAIDWLVATGLWPEGMPPTLDEDRLGLQAGSMSSAEREQAEAARRRREAEHQIRLDGRTINAEPENYTEIAQLVRESISPSLLATPPKPAFLAEIVTPGKSGSSPPAGALGSVTAARLPRLSPAQAGAVGLVGEVLALEWLRRHYEGVTEASWRSGYRNLVLGGNEGDDALGFDFEVQTRRQRLLFEVKSTVVDACQFELTDGEIRAAQSLGPRDRYQILFISKVLDTDERQIRVLPNPFSMESIGRYRTVNAGIRLRFQIG